MAGPDERTDRIIDVTDTVGRTIAAVRAHAGQTGHMRGLEQRMRSSGAMWPRRYDLGAGRIEEAVQIVPIG